MNEFEIISRDIDYIKKTTDNLSDKITSLSIEVAKVSTRVESLYNTINDQAEDLRKHEKDCPARISVEEVRKQFISFSIKLLISYIALAVAAVSAYGAVQKLF